MKAYNDLPSNWSSLSEDQKYQMTLETQIARFLELASVRDLKDREISQLNSLRQKLESFLSYA